MFHHSSAQESEPVQSPMQQLELTSSRDGLGSQSSTAFPRLGNVDMVRAPKGGLLHNVLRQGSLGAAQCIHLISLGLMQIQKCPHVSWSLFNAVPNHGLFQKEGPSSSHYSAVESSLQSLARSSGHCLREDRLIQAAALTTIPLPAPPCFLTTLGWGLKSKQMPGTPNPSFAHRPHTTGRTETLVHGTRSHAKIGTNLQCNVHTVTR